jgi:hypothetical protein
VPAPGGHVERSITVRSDKLRSRAVKVGAIALTGGTVMAAVSLANPPFGPPLTSVPTANQRAAGYAPASRLSPELQQVAVAQ